MTMLQGDIDYYTKLISKQKREILRHKKIVHLAQKALDSCYRSKPCTSENPLAGCVEMGDSFSDYHPLLVADRIGGLPYVQKGTVHIAADHVFFDLEIGSTMNDISKNMRRDLRGIRQSLHIDTEDVLMIGSDD